MKVHQKVPKFDFCSEDPFLTTGMIKRMSKLKFYSRLDAGKADRDNLSTDPC